MGIQYKKFGEHVCKFNYGNPQSVWDALFNEDRKYRYALWRIWGGSDKGNRPKDNSTRKDFTVEEQGKELADIVILADLNAQKLGIRLEEYVIKKFNAKSDKINSKVKL